MEFNYGGGKRCWMLYKRNIRSLKRKKKNSERSYMGLLPKLRRKDDGGYSGMSVLYLISLLFKPWYEKTVHHNIAHALFCIADALWLAVISKILGWW